VIAEIEQTDSGNTAFSQDEQRQIAVQLQQITEQLKKQFELTNEQTERIEEWREEVVEASERIGRKDWKLLAYGTIVNLAVTDVVTPDVARHIFTLLIQGIAHLIGGSGPPQIVERVHRTAYPTRKKAKEDIARYIELRYNRVRLHSALGYRTPQEVHDEYLNRQLAA
jgi:transposase InsO family protein